VSVRSFRSLTIVLALFSIAGLSACAVPPPTKMARVSTVQPTSYAPPPVTVLPPASAPVAPAAPSLADLASGPQHFEGLEGKFVLAALGDPNFRRRETPAEVWQYYGPGCILDLFLYDESSSGPGKVVDGGLPAGKVAHAELRGRENAPAEAGCLSRLIDQRHRHAAS
jgi:hypothetical protein